MDQTIVFHYGNNLQKILSFLWAETLETRYSQQSKVYYGIRIFKTMNYFPGNQEVYDLQFTIKEKTRSCNNNAYFVFVSEWRHEMLWYLKYKI